MKYEHFFSLCLLSLLALHVGCLCVGGQVSVRVALLADIMGLGGASFVVLKVAKGHI